MTWRHGETLAEARARQHRRIRALDVLGALAVAGCYVGLVCVIAGTVAWALGMPAP